MNTESRQMLAINSSLNQQSHISKNLASKAETHNILNDIENFSNVCRTCANVTEFVIPIFVDEGLQNKLAEKIHQHLPIKVTEEDVLPHVVCYQCASTLLAWHDLVECCLQADADLRRRLATLTKETKSKRNLNKSIEESEGNPNIKFNNNQEIVVQILETNHYENASGPTLVPTKICDYCNTEHPETQFKEHLISTHSELLFHCDECDSYVDRKDFIVHMSQHAVEYATESEEKEPVSNVTKTKIIKNTNENTESEITRYILTDTEPDKATEDEIDVEKNTYEYDTIIEENQDNDFSDHSDAEYFCELPKSVFEAIEDSQDTQTCENIERASQNDTSESIDDRNKSNDDILTQSPVLAEKTDGKKVKKERACPICSKVYTVSSSYFYHLKYSHKNDRDHECDVCGKKFSAKPTLAQHLLIHTGDCPYECKECGKKFRARASLYIHEQTHVGLKAHSCTECHKSFRWRAHLERHRKRHEGHKSHVCSTCGRGFSVHCDLLRHARTHSAGAFECNQCGLKFAQSRYMKTHMMKKHST